MAEFPETRDSLLLQLRDATDGASWDEFVAIYRPIVYRLARHRGLQDADAQDVAQRVLLSVANAVADWEADPQRARFRTWLGQVARNAIIDVFRRLRPDTGTGGTTMLQRLSQAPASPDGELDREHRREVFRWAAKKVRCEFAEETWQAFWITTVEARPAAEVAQTLGKTVGSIYTARSRVMRRLQQKVRESL